MFRLSGAALKHFKLSNSTFGTYPGLFCPVSSCIICSKSKSSHTSIAKRPQSVRITQRASTSAEPGSALRVFKTTLPWTHDFKGGLLQLLGLFPQTTHEARHRNSPPGAQGNGSLTLPLTPLQQILKSVTRNSIFHLLLTVFSSCTGGQPSPWEQPAPHRPPSSTQNVF